MKLFIILLIILTTQSSNLRAEVKNNFCRVALIQTSLQWGEVDENIKIAGAKIETCKDTDLIILPELFTSGCDMRKCDISVKNRLKDNIASKYNNIVNQMQQWAAKKGAAIVGSTIYKESGKYYNRLLVVFPDGEYEYYDKHNCFKKGVFSPGSNHLVFKWRGIRISTYICYDLRFAEWSDNSKDLYDIAIYIANWTESRGDDWNRLLRERAIENNTYVLAVNCIGTDLANKTYRGDSQVILPSGEVVVKATPFKEETLFFNIPIMTPMK